MKRLSVYARMIFVLAVVMAGLAGVMGISPASAQSSARQYTSELTGSVIKATGPWTVTSGETDDSGSVEVIQLDSELDQLLVAFLPGNVNLNEARDVFVNEFLKDAAGLTQLERGAYGSVSYSLDMLNVEGFEFGTFTLVLGGRSHGYVEAYFFMAPTFFFATDLEAVQQSVTVNGAGILDGVEGGGLQQLLDDNAGVTGGIALPSTIGDATEVATVTAPKEETPAPTEKAPAKVTKPGTEETEVEASDRDSRRLPTEDKNTVENESETGRGGSTKTPVADVSDFEKLGLIAEGEYVSPQFDTEILWDETWALSTDSDEPVASDVDNEMDSLTLVWSGEDYVLLFTDVMTADGVTPADMATYWASEEYLADAADPDAEVLLEDSDRTVGGVLLRDYLDDGTEVLILRQAVSLDRGKTLAVMTLIGLPETFSDAYADAQGGITIDGDPALDLFTSREIRRAQ